MGVYRVKVKGREGSILLRAKSKTEAIDAIVVEAKALTGEEVEDALAEGAKLWKPEEPLPVAVDAAVRRLVLAARAENESHSVTDELKDATEAFADRVPADAIY